MAAGLRSASPRSSRVGPMARRRPPLVVRFRRRRRRPPKGLASMAKAGASEKMRPRRVARRQAKPTRANRKETPRNERFLALHLKTYRHHAVGLRRRAGGGARLLVAAGILAAASRFSDHPNHHAAAGCQS